MSDKINYYRYSDLRYLLISGIIPYFALKNYLCSRYSTVFNAQIGIMIKLDEIDIKLLKALQRDAKANTKELCELLNLSKTPVYERIHRLEKEGVITGYNATIDNRKVGLQLVVFCNVSLAVHNDEHIERFMDDINAIDEVMECYSTGGFYDFLLKVILKDLDEYNKFVFEKLTKVHGIVKMQSSFVIREIKRKTELDIKL